MNFLAVILLPLSVLSLLVYAYEKLSAAALRRLKEFDPVWKGGLGFMSAAVRKGWFRWR